MRSALQGGKIQFFHFHHRPHSLGIFDQVREARGNDLPGETEFVFQPAALALGAANEEFRPIVVYIVLRVAANDERNGFVKFENGSTVQRGELLPVELESNSEHHALGAAGSARAAAHHIELSGILEDA